VAYKRDEAGWVENDNLGTENSADDWGGRLALLWQPTNRFSAHLKIIHQESDPEDGDAWNPDLGKFKRDVIVTEQRKTLFTQYNLTLKVGIDDWGEFISSTNYQETESNWLLQVGEIPGIGKLLNQTDPYDSEWFVQEIRFVAEPKGNIEWLAGAIYSEVDNGAEFRFVLNGLQDFVGSILGPGTLDSDDFLVAPNFMTSTEYAVYADLSWYLDDHWRITSGVRAFHFESDYQDTGSYLFDFASLGHVSLPEVANNSEDDDVTWRLALSYQPTDDRHYYLNISRGYRVGQVNPNFGPSFVDPTDVVIAESYDADESINYELGLKATLMDNRLQLNLAAYYIDWTDVQMDALRPSDQRNYIANAGDVISRGFELEAMYLLNESLDLRITASWQSAEVDSIGVADAVLSGAQAGDTLPGTPDFVGSFQANYSRALSGNLSLQAYLALQYVDESPNRFSRQPATGVPHPDFAINDDYANVDAGIGISTDHWDLTAYAENLADNDDIILDTGAVATASGENHYVALRPRTIGLRLDYRF
jgi:outer membrane receptor protein involved in Fe transport